MDKFTLVDWLGFAGVMVTGAVAFGALMYVTARVYEWIGRRL
jgi:hypothetical protein